MMTSTSLETVFENARKGDVEFFQQQQDDLPTYLSATDEDQRTLLHNAAVSGRPELVEFFLRHGAEPHVDAQDEEGWAPLHSAASCGFDRIVELLLLHGALVDVETSSKRTPLHYAVRWPFLRASKGHSGILKMLLKHGARVQAKDAIGFTPLHRAAASGKLQVVRILVDEMGAVIDIADRYGKTPFVVAVESRNESIVLFLAARGANLDVTLEDGRKLEDISPKLTQSIQDILEGRIDIDDLI